MTEFLIDANEELKRADHLLYVSLKYTRTVDVIRSIIERLITAHDFIINGYLNILKKEDKIEELPTAPGAKADVIKKYYKDNLELIEYIEFYLYMRKLIRSKYEAISEFRRHVTMISTVVDNETETKTIIKVDMDLVKEYYEKTKKLMHMYKKIVVKEEEGGLYD